MRVVHWFRNDLRLTDNVALAAACGRGTMLVPLFVFDNELSQVPAAVVHRPWQASPPPADYPPPIVDHAERRIVAIARDESARQARRAQRREADAEASG